MRYTALCIAAVLWTMAGTAHTLPSALKRQIEALRAQHHIPVVAVALITGDAPMQTLVLGASPSTPLRWGSITKTITALAVLALAEQGKVNLQAPLGAYIDQRHWGNSWRPQTPVRVIDLLEMRAGLTDLSAKEFDYNQPIGLLDALALAPEHRVARWMPGSQHVYSNMTAGLTQLLIETLTGEHYAKAVDQLVLQPLGMTAANFAPRPDLPGGFKADGSTPIPYWHMTFPAYGALNAPLTDMTALLAQLHRPENLSTFVRRHLFNPHGRRWHPRFRFDYAAGLYPRVRRGHVWHTHGGDADGYRSRLAVLSNGAGGYVASINTDNPRALRQLEGILERHLTRELPRPSPPASVALDAQQRADLPGSYYPSSVRFGVQTWQRGEAPSLRLEVDGDKIFAQRQGRRTALIATSATLFRREDDPLATVTIFHQQGEIYIQGELGNYKKAAD